MLLDFISNIFIKGAKMRYHNITKDDMLNGEGLRVVLWVAGCTHHCKNCHNPITWDIAGGIEFDEAAENEIYAELEKDHIDGITFSGGDPLHPLNRDDVNKLIQKIHSKYPNKSIWLYTGYTYEEIKDFEGLPYIDVLVDGEFVEELKDEKLYWIGSSNQRIIDVKNTLKTGEIVIYEDNSQAKLSSV